MSLYDEWEIGVVAVSMFPYHVSEQSNSATNELTGGKQIRKLLYHALSRR